MKDEIYFVDAGNQSRKQQKNEETLTQGCLVDTFKSHSFSHSHPLSLSSCLHHQHQLFPSLPSTVRYLSMCTIMNFLSQPNDDYSKRNDSTCVKNKTQKKRMHEMFVIMIPSFLPSFLSIFSSPKLGRKKAKIKKSFESKIR